MRGWIQEHAKLRLRYGRTSRCALPASAVVNDDDLTDVSVTQISPPATDDAEEAAETASEF